MSKKEVKYIDSDEFREILETFQVEKYDKLAGGVKLTFDTIMRVCDERDFYKQKCEMVSKRLKKESERVGRFTSEMVIIAYENAIKDCIDLLDLKMRD